MTNDDPSRTKSIRVGEREEALQSSYKINSKPCFILMAGSPQLIGKQWIMELPKVIIGRAAPADIIIPDESISKTHARIESKGGVFTVTDLGSTNKTFVNNREIAVNTPHEIKSNDQISFGKVIVRFLQQGLASETMDKERMQKELNQASEIQTTMFPAKNEFQYNSLKVHGLFSSASECCGDWWWYWVQNNKLYVILADATGHGASAALATSVAYTCIINLEERSQINLEEIYLALNSALFKSTAGKLKMSANILEIDPQQNKFNMINASHPSPILLGENTVFSNWKDVNYISCPLSPNLGTAEAQPTIEHFDITPGSQLFMYTDGLLERNHGYGQEASDRTFGQFLVEAQEGRVVDAKVFLHQIIETSNRKASFQPQNDDITLVMLSF